MSNVTPILGITPVMQSLVANQLRGQFPKELIENYPFFYKVNVGGAGATLTTPLRSDFFVNNKDNSTNGNFDTNWDGQNQIVDGQSLLRVKGFAFAFAPDVAVLDFQGVMLNSVFEFKVAEKLYLHMPVDMMGCFGGISGTDFPAAAGSRILTNGIPNRNNYYKVGSDQNPTVLNPQEKFEAFVLTEYATATRCKLVMLVDRFRTA